MAQRIIALKSDCGELQYREREYLKGLGFKWSNENQTWYATTSDAKHKDLRKAVTARFNKSRGNVVKLNLVR